MMKKILFLFITILGSFIANSQMNDCLDPVVNGCSSTDFIFSSVGDAVDDFPTGSVASGCLWSGDNQLIYLVLTANGAGQLEWSVQGDGNSGFMDWAIWPYDPATTCNELAAGTLAPLACCWNASSTGFAGMCDPANLPGGADPGNFQPPITLAPGQQVLLGISNYSGSLDGQNITLTFFDEALISCIPTTPDQTICEGNSATITINTPGLDSPTFNWLVTTGVSDPNSGTNVIVTPPVSTDYQVAVHQAATGSQIAVDTIISFTITVVTPPSPDAGIDQAICLGSPIVLNGVGTTSTDAYLWSSITTGIIPVPTVMYSPNATSQVTSASVDQPGIYSFVLQESNAYCPAATDTCIVAVIQLTQTVTQISPSCFGIADGQIQITDPLATEFSFDNGGTWQVSSLGTGFSAGTYTVCSRNAIGCQVCSNITVTDPAQVVVLVSNDTIICQNGSATLTASATGGTTYNYHWDMTANTGQVQVVSPTINTTYTVFAENQNGCVSSSQTIDVTIKNPLSGTITPDHTICPGETTSIGATCTGGDGGPYNFSWSTLETGVGMDDEIDDNPALDRSYTVTVTDGCESTPLIMSDTVHVATLVVPQFVVDDNEICEPAVFTLHNTTDPTLLGTYEWNISDGSSYSNVMTLNTTPLIAGHYDVQLKVTSPDGCIDSLTVNDFLISDPKPHSLFQFPSPIKMFNTTVPFTNTSTSAILYQWEFEEGMPSSSTDENPKIDFPDGVPGEYDVMLIATSDMGCIDTSYQTVIIVEEVLLYVPNAFTPDGDDYNQTWGIFVEGIDVTDFELLIYNRWGQIVWESHDVHASWDGTYASSPVQDGMYTWTITTKDLVNDAKYYFNGHLQLLR